jgi:diguanylate cyclase (GGDEF)-like protein
MRSSKEIAQSMKQLHLLYVEDDIEVQKSACEMFANFFTNITVASNGEEALELYNTLSIDVIITDIAMPKMNGLELIEKIRSYNRTIPIIVFSAWNDPSYISQCIKYNVDAYILKPLELQNLLDALYAVSLKVQDYQKSFKEQFDIDKLTGLKRYSILAESLGNLSKFEMPVMILVNIDEFHVYNEIYGLKVGDAILSEFSKILQTYNAQKDYKLYRISGDEFVLFEIVPSIDSEKYVNDIESLFHHIESSNIFIEGIEEKIHLSVTISVAFNSENLYERASMALKEARRRGRKYLGFSADVDRREELKHNLACRKEINRAISQNNVHVFYQPIMSRDKKAIRYEALIRLKNIDESNQVQIITPSDFIDFSKISKQYVALMKIVINEAFDAIEREDVDIAINIGYQDIENQEINHLLKERLQRDNSNHKTNFDISSKVIFELLDNPNREAFSKLLAFVEEYRELGVLFSIDNFGLGFSNMSSIAAMAPNYIKIDAVLIKNLGTDEHSYQLVKAIVQFCKELNIKTIAEYVETKEIFEICYELGIDEFQGFFFSEPLEKIGKG